MAMLEAATPVCSGLSGVGVVLEGISWETYEKLIEGIGEGHVRVTYDNGLMEIEMSPSRKHESDADFLRTLVTLICSRAGIPAELGGSTTHKRKDLARGVEPDGCYWIANEKAMRGVKQLDLTKHPAPDLVIEVDLTSRSVSKVDIYAVLGVPEIWHITDKGELTFFSLDSSSSGYTPIQTSRSFPFLKLCEVVDALNQCEAGGMIATLSALVDNLEL